MKKYFKNQTSEKLGTFGRKFDEQFCDGETVARKILKIYINI